MKHALAQWVEAMRTLPDNPWRGYLRLTELRRSERVQLRRRRLALTVVIATLSILISVLVAEHLTSNGIQLSDLSYFVPLFAGLVLYGALWLLGQFGRASAACLNLLARREGSMLSGQLDDGIALGELTDQQFIVGTLAHVLPRIWLALPYVAGLLWYWNALHPYWLEGPFQLPSLPRAGLGLVVRHGVWLWLSFVLNGMLATTILGLILITIGRGVRLAISLPLVNTALLIHLVGYAGTMLPFAHAYFLSGLINVPATRQAQLWERRYLDPFVVHPAGLSTSFDGLPSHLMSIGVLFAVVAIGLLSGLRVPVWRGLLLLITLLPAPVYVITFVVQLFNAHSDYALRAGHVAPWWLIGLGILHPLDPLAFQLPVPLLAGDAWPWPRETLYWPLQVGAQVLLLVLTAGFAARSVRLSRSGE